jgi:hypothetical protein
LDERVIGAGIALVFFLQLEAGGAALIGPSEADRIIGIYGCSKITDVAGVIIGGGG